MIPFCGSWLDLPSLLFLSSLCHLHWPPCSASASATHPSRAFASSVPQGWDALPPDSYRAYSLKFFKQLFSDDLFSKTSPMIQWETTTPCPVLRIHFPASLPGWLHLPSDKLHTSLVCLLLSVSLAWMWDFRIMDFEQHFCCHVSSTLKSIQGND